MTERTITPPVRAPADEARALREHAIVVLRDDRSRWMVSGHKAAEVLNGLVTNDVSALAPGAGCYAAALTPKGKVIADLRIFALADGFLLDTVTAAAAGLAAMLRKYVNPRLARIEEVTAETRDIAVAGPAAVSTIQRALAAELPLASLAPHASLELTLPAGVRFVARSPEIGLDAFDLILPNDEHARVHGLLTEADAKPAESATWEVARVSRGWPVWGKDFDESTLAQEANLDALGAISYTKGCYTGQETVARVHFRGHVNRYLRRGRFAAGDGIPNGAELVYDGKAVGEIRSSAVTAEIGVAIAMVRREVDPSATVTTRWNSSQSDLNLLD